MYCNQRERLAGDNFKLVFQIPSSPLSSFLSFVDVSKEKHRLRRPWDNSVTKCKTNLVPGSLFFPPREEERPWERETDYRNKEVSKTDYETIMGNVYYLCIFITNSKCENVIFLFMIKNVKLMMGINFD